MVFAFRYFLICRIHAYHTIAIIHSKAISRTLEREKRIITDNIIVTTAEHATGIIRPNILVGRSVLVILLLFTILSSNKVI
jgi:hypothetical protein